jgi:threonylcarbamoyladenosine tRNA methylthiotransferase MtaB
MRVAIATLGCKVNQYDSAVMQTSLLQRGDRVVPFEEGADVYVVNSCTVTDRADAESRRLARRARRLNPGAVVIMTGCFAQASPDAAALCEVDHVVGIGRLHDLLQVMREGRAKSGCRILVDNLRKVRPGTTMGAEALAGQTRAFLKVQEGCDLFCSYCIVPLARGPSRSIAIDEVLARLHRLAALGFVEVVLTGVHLGAYGADLHPPVDLADLIEAIAAARPVPRVRLSSVDPPEVTPRLLAIMSRSDVLCPHLHVPVQAGADRTLHRMRRRYDTALVRDVLREVRLVLPDAGLGTDIIAGFPGETEADFESGLAFLGEQPFTYFHVFPYSCRRGTAAARLPGHVAASDVAARARRLRRLGDSRRAAFAQRWVEGQARVLVENTRDRQTGFLAGYSRNYIRVVLPGPDEWMNTEISARVAGRSAGRLIGTPEMIHDGLRGRVAV